MVFIFAAAVAFNYKINKRFSIQSGLYYSSLGQKVDGINSFGGFQKYDYSKKGTINFEVLTTNGTIYTINADVFLVADGTGGRIITNFTKDVFDPNKASVLSILTPIHYTRTSATLMVPIILKYKVIDKVIDFNLYRRFIL